MATWRTITLADACPSARWVPVRSISATSSTCTDRTTTVLFASNLRKTYSGRAVDVREVVEQLALLDGVPCQFVQSRCL